jgi:adenosylhomocysteinase
MATPAAPNVRDEDLFPEILARFAADDMPFLRRARRRALRTRPYAGLAVLHNVPLTAETMCKIEVLVAGGADLVVTSPSFTEADPRSVAALAAAGVEFRTEYRFSEEFDVVLDCGGELQPLVTPRLGTCELTRTGTLRYRAANPAYPVIAVDESRVKNLESLLGTGRAFVHAFRRLVDEPIDGKPFLVFGYGKVGKGVVRALAPHTDRIGVVDTDPGAVDAARLAGCDAMHATEADRVEAWAGQAFAVVTATGVPGIVSSGYDAGPFRGAHLANMGGEDEFGEAFTTGDVLYGKRPVNFAHSDPHAMRYLDPVFHAHNLGIDLLACAQPGPGVTPFPAFLADEIVDAWQRVSGERLEDGADPARDTNRPAPPSRRWDDGLRHCASHYVTTAPFTVGESPEFRPMTESSGMLVADLFAAMRHEPGNPLVRASYQQYIREITEQYEFVVAELGLRVEPWPHSGEPYRDSRRMIEDVRQRRHLYFLTTHARWGEAGTGHVDHPMLNPTGIVIGGVELLVNDLFRVVHDVFGHAKEGHQFGPVGEEKAWLAHHGMFSPLARPALTAETRGQTCWMYFGAHLRGPSGALVGKDEPGWVPVPRRPFAEQKAGLLPADVSGVRLTHDPGSGHVRAWPLTGWRPDTHHALRTGRQPTEIDSQLAGAYRSTTFRALTTTGPIDIHVGQSCPDLDALLRRESVSCWAFLTACSPGGRVLPAAENQQRHLALRRRLHGTGVPVVPGLGIGVDPDWLPEDSVLAVGLDRSTAATLGAEFGQDAIVVGDLGAAAELLWCRTRAATGGQ